MGAAFSGPPKAQSLVTKQQYDAAVADWSKTHAVGSSDAPVLPGTRNQFASQADYNEGLQSFKDTMGVLPPPAPDLADETVQRARQAARRKLLMGGLTGPLDLSGASATAKLPGLGGT